MQKNLATDTLDITLSYILTTYNKLPYLQTTLPYLIDACKADEEIVIVDGGSSDGTPAYLLQLLEQKKIHRFISEKDSGESHGTNKAIMIARGELLKIITDDDLFDFNVIAYCKQHLLAHKEIDMCGSDGLGMSTLQPNNLLITRYCEGFMEWKKTGAPFLFCGLSYLIRKSSISRLGLLSTQVKMIDLEYSVRVSAMKANIVFCNAYSFVNIVGADSNSHKFYDHIKLEKKKLQKMYPTICNLNNPNNLYQDLKEKIKKIIGTTKQPAPNPAASHNSYLGTVAHGLEVLKEKNRAITPGFL